MTGSTKRCASTRTGRCGGLHAGPVVTGDIGGAGRFAFAAIGDTVNFAERLQGLTREAGASLVASDPVLRRAGVPDPAAAGFVGLGGRRVRGRADPLTLWASPESAAPTLAGVGAPPIPEG